MARGTPAAEAFVKLWVDNNELRRGLVRSERMVTRFSRRIQSVGVNFARMSAVIAASTVAPIRAFMGWEQASARFAVTFRNNLDEANEAVERVARNTGKLSRVALRVFNEAASIAIGGGMNPDEILKTSEALSEMAIDLSEFAKISPTAALNAIGASLSGSGRRMRMYGVDVRETAEELEHIRHITESLGEAEGQRIRTMIKLNKIQKSFSDQGIAGFGTGTSSTFFQAWDEFKAVMQEIAEVVGEHLARGLQKFTSIISANRQAIVDYINRFGKILEWVPALAIGLGAIGISLKLIGITLGWFAKLLFGVLKIGVKLIAKMTTSLIKMGKTFIGVSTAVIKSIAKIGPMLSSIFLIYLGMVSTFIEWTLMMASMAIGAFQKILGGIGIFVSKAIGMITVFAFKFTKAFIGIASLVIAKIAVISKAIVGFFVASIPVIIGLIKLIIAFGKLAVVGFVAGIIMSFNRLQQELGGIFQGVDWREMLELGMMERAFEILGKSIKFIFADAIAAIPRFFRDALDEMMLSITAMPPALKRILGFDNDSGSIFTRGLGKKSQDRADNIWAELQELVALTKQEMDDNRKAREQETQEEREDSIFDFDASMGQIGQDISRSIGTFFKNASDTLNNPSIDRGLRTQIQQLQEQRNSTNLLREIALNTGLSAVTVGTGATSTGGLNFS